MKKMILFVVALASVAPSTSGAADFLGWLKTGSSSSTSGKKALPADTAVLLTLEPAQNEMYPRVSPDSKSFLVDVDSRQAPGISRRLLENGDPLNAVSDDEHAVDSVAWYGNEEVSFLSSRAGGLGLWTKPADGRGILRRAIALHGDLTQTTLLADGSLIGVRLLQDKNVRATKSDGFNNWEIPGERMQVVRISADGAERMLSEGSNPAVSPDGQWVVFSMAAGRSRHLFLMRIDGSELMQLTDDRSIDAQPAWSPDGNTIVFVSDRADADLRNPEKGNWDIWAIGRDGRNLMRLTMDPARDGAPSVARGNHVLFHSDRKISREQLESHQVKGSTSGFHVWSIDLPAVAAK